MKITLILIVYYFLMFIFYSNIIEFIIPILLIGIFGIILNNKNLLKTMLCLELVYISLIVLFNILILFYLDWKLQVYSLTLLIIAACESAIGLGILIILYRFGKSINFLDYQELRG